MSIDGSEIAVLSFAAGRLDTADLFVDWNATPAPVMPADGANEKPVLQRSDVVLDAYDEVPLSDLVRWSDADGDDLWLLEIRDLTANRAVSATVYDNSYATPRPILGPEPKIIDGDLFSQLTVTEGRVADDDGISIRAFDGHDWTDWIDLT